LEAIALDDEITAADYRALAELRHQLRRFLHFSERVAREAGLTPQQHQALLALRGLPPGCQPTVQALAERLQVRHHSAVELVDRLVERGLVRRSRGEQDRRQVFVVLTPEGDRLLRLLSLHHRAELRSAGPALVRALGALLDDDLSAPE
jgi:DNA-binding MarR family transcriptional regulator